MATDFFIVIAAGFCGGVLARLLRQPLVLGYLVAGIVVGPHTGGISVGDPANLERLAEIGATLLLFGLGLELSLRDLAPVRRVALFGTPIQIALTMAVAWPIGAWLGLRWAETVWLGALVSLSSTLVVLKALQSQGRIGTLSSRVMLGMLVAQDLAFIPLMIVLPRLGSSDAGASAAAFSVLKAVALLAGLLVIGTRVIPRLVEWVARSGSRELFLLVTMGIALGIAFVTHEFGVSSAVGAFVAGLVLSESDYSHQALSDIIPLRDVFSLLFFASVGMLLDPTHVLGQWRAISLVVAVISVSKGLIFAGVTRAFGYRNIVPLASALGLFGIGEFSFVLARTGFAAGAISGSLYALVLNTAIITMVLTPVVSGLTTPIYGWMSRRRAREPVQTINMTESGLAGHIIVAGAGRVGCRIAEVLQGLQLPFVVVEVDHRRIDHAKEQGYPTIFGDAAQPTVLEAAGIGRARLLLVTTPVLGVSRAVVEHARRINPAVDVVVRAESADEMASLRAMGVSEVVQPDLEASLEMTRQALVHLRMSALDIVHLTDRLRADQYAPADAPGGTSARTAAGEDRAVISTLAAATRLLDLRWVRIVEGSLLAGRRIGEADVRTWLKVTVVGVVSAGRLNPSPGPDHVLAGGDLVAVVGDRQHVDGFDVAAGN
jgi:CPA2 family monovalent cation:H+ antiporter-2